jgi:glutamate N-acetyltransferase/amino-acid N-acetyltransferase
MADVMPATRQISIAPIEGGITAPTGFRSAAVHCGIKARPGALDLAVIAVDTFASIAGIFTTNLAQAAPVLVSKRHLDTSHGIGCAIVVNSGCANACTGEEGLANAKRMTEAVADALGCPAEQVLVASTGVIGVALPMDRVVAGIQEACSSLAHGKGSDAAQAIMTTDPFPKEHAVRVTTPRGSFVVGAMAKGSGMIEPNMATMLGFIATDAQVKLPLLHRALLASARDTFNAITVDGECSTNDTLFAMASGTSGVTIDEELYPALLDGLLSVSEPLALGIVRGGEGATKVIAVSVYDARTVDDARQVARTIANSPLVKTAVHGADPNWGRIVAAAGRAGVRFDMQRITVRIGGILLFENGLPHDESAPRAAEILKRDTVDIEVSLGGGDASATIWGCDLSAEYVRINGEYRT